MSMYIYIYIFIYIYIYIDMSRMMIMMRTPSEIGNASFNNGIPMFEDF